jgi:hypothetical protein
MVRVAVAPIRSKAGQVVGALLVGYVSSAQDAAADRKKLGVHVAYFLDGKVQASSFGKEGGQESAEEKAIADSIFGAGKPAEQAAAGDLSKSFSVKMVDGEEYVAAAGPLPGNLTHPKAGFVVLASVTAAQAFVGKVTGLFWALGALGLLCVLGATLGTALRFVRPLDTIETGVAEVINGNHDYTFETTSPDYEGVANALNLMVARLTGRPDPSDDDLGGGGDETPEDQAPVSNASGGQLSAENAKIAAEPEDVYFKRTFEEFVASRKRTGESTEGLTLDAFSKQLKTNEEPVKAKNPNVSRVRFKVVVQDGKTTLKPILIP